ATLLFTCLVFVLLGRTHKGATLTALTVAAVVCIAASNGGTTSQDLKTGYLVGATPRLQQLAILVASLTSALVIGVTLLLLNRAGTVYTTNPEFLPAYHVPDVGRLSKLEQPGGEYAAKDKTLYHVLHVAEGEVPDVPQGKYLVDDTGRIRYLVDPAINGRVSKRDDGTVVPNKFDAPKTRLMALIVGGIMNQKLPWGLVLMGVLIAITLELAGVPSLPFAVGVYLPIQTSVPIFIGGAVRWVVDKVVKRPGNESDMSPGTLLSTGYIAGGTIGGVVIAFLTFAPSVMARINVGRYFPALEERAWPAAAAFGVLIVILLAVGFRKAVKNPPIAERNLP
ncbi:MAG: putative oligopeptide transporter, family, partial [Phycisphaerales bacterium]|nr:putative oligopeptide transporter, family [Phycisphaerales bacterium]